jgi:hypothetical protein
MGDHMLNRLNDRISTGALAYVSGFSLMLNLAATAWLNASYAASKFPVPYHIAQLSFDAQRIKNWYAYLIEEETLAIYRQTQFIDFGFIATVLLLHVSVLWLVSRLFEVDSFGRRWMEVIALLSAVAPLADTLENMVSFVMLYDPAGFPDSLALVYSSLAATKFTFFILAYVALPVGVMAGLVSQCLRRREAKEP